MSDGPEGHRGPTGLHPGTLVTFADNQFGGDLYLRHINPFSWQASTWGSYSVTGSLGVVIAVVPIPGTAILDCYVIVGGEVGWIEGRHVRKVLPA